LRQSTVSEQRDCLLPDLNEAHAFHGADCARA